MHIWISIYILHEGVKWGLFLSGEANWFKESDFGREKSEIWERLMDCSLPQRNSTQIIDSFSRWNYQKWCLERDVYFSTCCLSQASLCSFSPLLYFLQFPEDTLLLSSSRKPASCIAWISPVSWRQNCETIKFLSFIFPVPLHFAEEKSELPLSLNRFLHFFLLFKFSFYFFTPFILLKLLYTA